MTKTFRRKLTGLAGTCVLGAIAALCLGCGQPQADAPQPQPLIEQPEAPPLDPVHLGEEPLKSPLLESLRQHVQDLETEETSRVTKPLSQQLADTDVVLADAKEKNRAAIRQANRQVRMGPALQSPNFVLITVDRMGVGDLGCYGQTRWPTPHLDELAANGMRFTAAYSGGLSVALSHAALMSGQFSGSTESKSVSMPRVMWNGGYSTCLLGDLSFVAKTYESSSGWSLDAPEFPDWVELNGHRVSLESNSAGQKKVSQAAFLDSELRSILNEASRRKNSFFLHMSLPLFGETKLESEALAGYEQRIRAADESVGRLLRSLEATGLSKRTCIIFTALSGPSPEMNSLVEQTGSCGQFTHSKHGLSEGNLRVPFLVQWLGAISPATVSDEVLSLCDLLPTFVQLGWISRPVGRIDGQSLADVWRQRNSVPERRQSWKSSANGSPRAVRDRHWKLIVTNGAMQLFDLRSDPGEQSDVAAERADIVQGLAK